MSLNTVEEIIQDIRLGRMVVLMDDENRENEGDLVMAAECVAAEHINFMARHACGLICMPMSRSRSERLGLRLMVERNGSGFGTKFTTSIEAATGVTTGISAADRALTVKTAAARHASSADIVQPGHIFPLIAEAGGVLVRAGHTEAACDLARLAGFQDAGVICEIMNDDGSMARRPELELFAQKHGLKIGTIADLIHYRALNESTVEELTSDPVETEFGKFRLHTFRDRLNGVVHLAMARGALDASQPVLTRVQIMDSIRDVLAIDVAGVSGWNVRRSLQRIAKEGTGALVLLNGGETPADLLQSVEIAVGRQHPPAGRPTTNPNFLTLGVGSQILRSLGVRKLRLMSSPVKHSAISGFDLEVVEYVSPN